MEHPDHVRLLGGIPQPGETWADFGSGEGAFTLALADLLGPAGVIYSVDRDAGALRRQEQTLRARFAHTRLHSLAADFTRPVQLPALDGILAANSLHFLARKEAALGLIRSYLKPGGRLIVIEYNVDRGNMWVPHPFSFDTWQAMAQSAGFLHIRLLAVQPSRFLGQIYSALSLAPS